MQTKFEHFSGKVRAFILAFCCATVAILVLKPGIFLACKNAIFKALTGALQRTPNAVKNAWDAIISILERELHWQDVIIFLAFFFVAEVIFSYLYEWAAERQRKLN